MRPVVLVMVALVLASVDTSFARLEGNRLLSAEFAFGCGCHDQGRPPNPTVTLQRLDGDGPLFEGATPRFRLTVSGGPGDGCGFRVRATGATVRDAPLGSIRDREVVHRRPQPAIAGQPCAFDFALSVDGSEPEVTLDGYGNSVNSNGSPGGDAWGTATTLRYPVGPRPPIPSADPISIVVTTTQGQHIPARTLTVANVGTGTLVYRVGVDQPWLSVTPTTGATTNQETHQLVFDPAAVAALGPGGYEARVTISADAAFGSTATLPVSLRVNSGRFTRTEITLPGREGSGEGIAIGRGADGGPWIAVGAPNLGQGEVYLYRKTDEGWELDTVLTHPGGRSSSGFGWSVALSGDDLWVGTRQNEAFAFTRRTQTIDDHAVWWWEGLSVDSGNDFSCDTRDQHGGCQVTVTRGFAAVTGSVAVHTFERTPGGWRSSGPIHPISAWNAQYLLRATAGGREHLGMLLSAYAFEPFIGNPRGFLGAWTVPTGAGDIIAATDLRALTPPSEIRDPSDRGDSFAYNPSAIGSAGGGRGAMHALAAHASDDHSRGAVYAFEKLSANAEWRYVETLRSEIVDPSDPLFGSAAAVDGDRAAVTSYRSTHVYEYRDGWKLFHQEPGGGSALALDGDTVVVGTGRTHVLEEAHGIDFFRAAGSASPTVRVGTSVNMGAFPEDSMGHPLTGEWTFSCTGRGTEVRDLDDTPTRTHVAWTPPICAPTPLQQCTATYTARDDFGKEASTSLVIVVEEDTRRDWDADNLTLLQENEHGTDPCNADSDGDGTGDWYELSGGSDPLNAEADADGVPDAVDNCPRVPNSDQQDLDDDDDGDACDDNDTTIELRRARIRPSSGAHRPNGNLMVSGDIMPASAADAFDLTAGLAVEIGDALGVRDAITWAPDECRTLRSGRVTCRSADGSFKQVAMPLSARPGVIRFRLRLRQRDFPGPIGPDVFVRVTSSPGAAVAGIDRVGALAGCRSTATGTLCGAR